MAKSSPKSPSRAKPSSAKKSASKPASKAKQSSAKSSRSTKKTKPEKPAARKTVVSKSAIQKPIGRKLLPKQSTHRRPGKLVPVKASAKLRPEQPVKTVKGKSKSTAKSAQTKITAKPVIAAKAVAKPAAKSKTVAQPKPVAVPVQIKAEPFKAGPSVATNLKPRKSQIGLTVKELEHFADLLLAKRRELVGDMSSMEREALRSGSATNLSTLPMHMADMGTDNFEQEFTLGLVEKDRNLLREINNALSKIQNGTYGICEGTGMPISKARLEAAPWSRFSIEYARQKEKNGMGVRTL